MAGKKGESGGTVYVVRTETEEKLGPSATEERRQREANKRATSKSAQKSGGASNAGPKGTGGGATDQSLSTYVMHSPAVERIAVRGAPSRKKPPSGEQAPSGEKPEEIVEPITARWHAAPPKSEPDALLGEKTEASADQRQAGGDPWRDLPPVSDAPTPDLELPKEDRWATNDEPELDQPPLPDMDLLGNSVTEDDVGVESDIDVGGAGEQLAQPNGVSGADPVTTDNEIPEDDAITKPHEAPPPPTAAATGEKTTPRGRRAKKRAAAADDKTTPRGRRAKKRAAAADDKTTPRGRRAKKRAPAADVPATSTRPKRPFEPPSDVPPQHWDPWTTANHLLSEMEKVSPRRQPKEFGEFLGHGPRALDALAQRFPGPLWFKRHKERNRLAEVRGTDVSRIAWALIKFGEEAVPHVVELLEHEDNDIRFHACLVAGDLHHEAIAQALSCRLYDEDDEVSQVAMLALSRIPMGAGALTVCNMLKEHVKDPSRDIRERGIAMHAVAAIGDTSVTALLIDMLAHDPNTKTEAWLALRRLTGQDFQKDVPKWKKWLKRNAKKHRVQWLIASLVHEDRRVREIAWCDLRNVTNHDLGYNPHAPKPDRRAAQKRYLKWWKARGRAG